MTSNLSFQSVQTKSTLSDELRSAIRDNILFFIQDQEPEDEGISALYERLSQEDKADGESNSIANQKGFWNGTAGIMGLPLFATMTRTMVIPGRTSTVLASSGCLPTSRRARSSVSL